jgi:ribosomal protein L11 methyltransferase
VDVASSSLVTRWGFFVYLWRKRAELLWVKAHEDLIQAHADGQLVIIRAPGRKRLDLEIVYRSRRDSTALLREFGGRIETLPRNWMERFTRVDSKPIKIGKRLVISNVEGTLESRMSRHGGRSHIIIPASLAFGTGEHATTAMSLSLLEQLTRSWKRGWSLLDLGTGSGILVFAAKRFGASRVTGIDNDPAAISVAKSNARLNKIRGACFQLGDVRERKLTQKTDVITANLCNDLLIKILPTLNARRWLILSGILRDQQKEFLQALSRNRIESVRVKRRGKWISVLAQNRAFGRKSALRCPDAAARRPYHENFCGAH